MKPPKKLKFLPGSGEKFGKTNKATRLILASNYLINPDDIDGESLQMESLRLQRAIFDMIHLQCNEDTIYRFLEFFSDNVKEKIMLSCWGGQLVGSVYQSYLCVCWNEDNLVWPTLPILYGWKNVYENYKQKSN